MAESDPVTKAELQEELDKRFLELDTRLDTRFAEMEERLVETMRDMQTEIIRVFMEFQQRNESRDSANEKSQIHVVERMSSIERRLLDIEKKLLLNPPAA